MVMSTSFVSAVALQFPGASIDLVAKKGIDFLLAYFPAHDNRFVFSKDEYPGINGALKFGKLLRSKKKYDLFFCLPDSLSSAIMAYGTSARKRVGFQNGIRTLLMTNCFSKKKKLHRVEEYVDLLQQYVNKTIAVPPVFLSRGGNKKRDAVIVNINSEASSRRLPVSKAVSLISSIRRKIGNEIILIGSPKEKSFVDEVYDLLEDKENITNAAGTTTLPQLIDMMSNCKVMLTTDSGPAHVANAAGTYTIVLFGAGNEKNTAPYNKKTNMVIRLGELRCEPCTRNVCELYDVPKCLTLLDDEYIAGMVLTKMA